MMESWEEITAEVKQQSDIVQVISEQVKLRRSGVRYLGLCPFHQEKTPSFSVHPGQQFYYCFGCGAAGDVFSFVMNYYRLEFIDALKMLAERCHITLPQRQKTAQEEERQRYRQQLYDTNAHAAAIFHDYLCNDPGAAVARRYLETRGISDAVRERYRLGYAPSPEGSGWNFLGSQLNNEEIKAALVVGLLVAKDSGGHYDRFRDRLMCPIIDARGRVAGFGGRILGDGNPKYLNSPESPVYNKSRLLFGLFQQRDAIRKCRRAIVVEGNFDLLSLVTNGCEPVVAPLGTALTKEQVRLLKPLVDEAVLLFDGDDAGYKAAERAAPLFIAEQVSGRVAALPQGHDPDTYVRQFGLTSLNNIIEQAETLPEFVLQQLVQRHGMSLDGKTRIVEELRPLLNASEAGLQRSLIAAHFASLLGVDAQLLQAQLTAPAKQDNHQQDVPRSSEKKTGATVDRGLRRVLSYLVLNPARLDQLEDAGVGEIIVGGIGEIIVLQLKRLTAERGSELQPEDLLTALPEGEERRLVSSLLLDPEIAEYTKSEPEQEIQWLQDITSWVRRMVLKRRSDDLMNAINEAEKHNDFRKISGLLSQKMTVDAELKTL